MPNEKMNLEGKWPDILRIMGVDSRLLTGKHGPCPKCGGKDRYRFTDFKGNGNWFCKPCGGGDGFDLLKVTLGYGFADAKKRIEEINGDVKAMPAKKPVDTKRLCQGLWRKSNPIMPGDIADRYLSSRGITLRPGALHTLMNCPSHKSGFHPAMLAKIKDKDGVSASLHRTYLCETGKANLESVREMMPGTMPPGAAVWLSKPEKIMGIAEGIETALSASQLFSVPVWASLNAGLMEKWLPPSEAEEIIIFGDHDAKHVGQKAAFTLASKLSSTHKVSVKIPERPGDDWNDVLIKSSPSDSGPVRGEAKTEETKLDASLSTTHTWRLTKK